MKVLLGHGMLDLADLNVHLGAVDGNDGDVLLDGRVNGAGDKLDHLLAAAHHRDARIDDLDGDVAAVFAFEKFDIHGNPLKHIFGTP